MFASGPGNLNVIPILLWSSGGRRGGTSVRCVAAAAAAGPHWRDVEAVAQVVFLKYVRTYLDSGIGFVPSIYRRLRGHDLPPTLGTLN